MESASKYQPLERHLRHLGGREAPMKFAEVERVLGFDLPPSARRHAAWWSNNRGTNVAVKAWRDAGWRTSRVDVGGERVVFVREVEAEQPPETHVAPAPAGAIIISLDQLGPAAIKLIDDYSHEHGCDRSVAAAAVLNAAGIERRRALFDWFKANERAPAQVSSADLVREDRDAR